MSTNSNTPVEKGSGSGGARATICPHCGRRFIKTRGARGELNGKATLNDELVTRMRLRWLEGATEVELAQQFGTSISNVSKIICGQSWRHVPWPEMNKQKQFEQQLGGEGVAVTLAATVAALAVEVVLVGLMASSLWDRLPWRKPKPQFVLRPIHPQPPQPPMPPAPAPLAAALPVPPEEDAGDVGDEHKPVQAVKLRAGDRAWKDEDVQVIAGSKRFQVLIGGRSDREREKRA